MARVKERNVEGFCVTHQLHRVSLVVLFQVIQDVPVFHPRGNDSDLLRECDSDERQDVWMGYPLPDHGFATQAPLGVGTSGSTAFL